MPQPTSTLPDLHVAYGELTVLRNHLPVLYLRSVLLRERFLAGVAAVGGLVLLALMAVPLLTGRIPVYFDLGCFHFPVRDFYSRCLKGGEAFDWLPAMHNGVFITGEGEHGPYHPLHLLLYRMLPLHTAFAAEVWLSFPLMFLGTFVFLRAHASRAGALLGALVYTFCANNVSHGHHVNYVAVLAHLPWLLWLLERIALTTGPRRWRAAAGVGLLTGSQLLLGHPQVMSYSLFAEGLYALFLARLARAPARAALAWCAGKALGLAVGGVQLLATLSFLSHSNRGSFDPLFGPYVPSRLIQLLVPNLMCRHLEDWCSEPAYFGAVPVVLLAWWLASRRGMPSETRPSQAATRQLTGFAVTLGVLATWLALGEYGGLYLLQTRLPLAGQFRSAARYVNLASFAAAVLSALGFARLAAWVRVGRRLPWRSLALPWLAASLTVAAGLAFQVSHPLPDSTHFDRRFVSGMVVMVAAATALTLACRGRSVGLYGLLVIAILDLHHFCLENPLWGESLWRRTPTLDQWRAQTPLPPETSVGRVLNLSWEANGLTLHGLRLVNGYRGGIEPCKRLDYGQVASLRLSGAAWYREAALGTITIPGLPSAGGGWYRVPEAFPRARLVSAALASADPARDLIHINLTTTALTTHEIPLEGGPLGDATLADDHPGRLRVLTEASGCRLLVVSESHDPGWQAAVDGQTTAVERVNGDFLGCVVGPGRHTVDFLFRPTALRVGWLLSAMGAMACVLLGVWTLRPRPGRRAIP